jgi:hypothetical protein
MPFTWTRKLSSPNRLLSCCSNRLRSTYGVGKITGWSIGGLVEALVEKIFWLSAAASSIDSVLLDSIFSEFEIESGKCVMDEVGEIPSPLYK